MLSGDAAQRRGQRHAAAGKGKQHRGALAALTARNAPERAPISDSATARVVSSRPQAQPTVAPAPPVAHGRPSTPASTAPERCQARAKYTCPPPVSLSPIPLSLSLSETALSHLHHPARTCSPRAKRAPAAASSLLNSFGRPLHRNGARPSKASTSSISRYVLSALLSPSACSRSCSCFRPCPCPAPGLSSQPRPGPSPPALPRVHLPAESYS